MIWYHSTDPKTLTLDEQFLFGSHVLVAPVLTHGHQTKRVYLPSRVDGSNEAPEWCEWDTGLWHTSSLEGNFITMSKWGTKLANAPDPCTNVTCLQALRSLVPRPLFVLEAY